MFKTAIVVLFSLPLLTTSAACGGPSSAPQSTSSGLVEPAPSSDAASPKESDSFLGLADVQILGGPRAISILADGQVMVDGAEAGTLYRDGRFVTASATFRLMPDGSIEGAEQLMRIRVLQSGVVTHGGRAQMSIDTAGLVTPIESGPSGLRLEGPSEGWQAAMFISVLSSDANLL